MKKTTGCLLGLLLLLLLRKAGAAAWPYWRSNQFGLQAFVQIRGPPSGILAAVNESLRLAARAFFSADAFAASLVVCVNGLQGFGSLDNRLRRFSISGSRST